MVGGTYLQRNLSLMAPDGRLVQIGFLQSPIIEKFDMRPVMLRRLTLTGSTLRARSVDQKAPIAAALRDEDLAATGSRVGEARNSRSFPAQKGARST